MSEQARPFFSLVIPCYNDGRYKAGDYLDRLLTSVQQSNLGRDDIEIILADDHSPKPYIRLINKFSKVFNIKFIETEYNFAPGNTREAGTHVATGEWICFADHDDTFYPRALKTVMDMIKADPNDPVYVYADFDKVDSTDLSVIKERFYNTDNNALFFVHGKFYNRDKFWKPFHIHFPKDLRTHEDIAVGSQVDVALTKVAPERALHIPTPVYRWTDNGTSISNVRYQDSEHTFFERAYSDYLESGVGQYVELCKKGQMNRDELTNKVLPKLLQCWFELARFKVNNPDNYIKENINYVKKWWQEYKEASGYTTTIIKMIVAKGLSQGVTAINSTAAFYHLDDFDTWIAILDKEETNEQTVL